MYPIPGLEKPAVQVGVFRPVFQSMIRVLETDSEGECSRRVANLSFRTKSVLQSGEYIPVDTVIQTGKLNRDCLGGLGAEITGERRGGEHYANRISPVHLAASPQWDARERLFCNTTGGGPVCLDSAADLVPA